MSTLDGARLKLERAREHFDALQCELKAYVGSQPYQFPHSFDSTMVTVHHAEATPPPDRFSVIIGDCVNNLRECLDYIVWALACKHTDQAQNPKVGEERDLSFPMCHSSKTFEDRGRKKLEEYCIPENAIAIIESLQLYHSKNALLMHLNALRNQNAHCLLLLMNADAKTRNLKVKLGDGREAWATAASSLSVSQYPKVDRRGVAIDGEVTIFVSIRHDDVPIEPVEGLLERIIDCVSGIVESCQSFF